VYYRNQDRPRRSTPPRKRARRGPRVVAAGVDRGL